MNIIIRLLVMLWSIFTFSSCINSGTTLMEFSPSINDTIITNQGEKTYGKDTIFIRAGEFFERNHGDKGSNKSRCNSNDSIGYYFVYRIALWADSIIPFSVHTLNAIGEDGYNIPICTYYGVLRSVNDEASILIDSIPFDMYTGMSYDRSKFEKHGYDAVIFVEICKPIRRIKKMEISFCLDVGGQLFCYNSKYEMKWFIEFRPKLF